VRYHVVAPQCSEVRRKETGIREAYMTVEAQVEEKEAFKIKKI
jgi:hypothetical protein